MKFAKLILLGLSLLCGCAQFPVQGIFSGQTTQHALPSNEWKAKYWEESLSVAQQLIVQTGYLPGRVPLEFLTHNGEMHQPIPDPLLSTRLQTTLVQPLSKPGRFRFVVLVSRDEHIGSAWKRINRGREAVPIRQGEFPLVILRAMEPLSPEMRGAALLFAGVILLAESHAAFRNIEDADWRLAEEQLHAYNFTREIFGRLFGEKYEALIETEVNEAAARAAPLSRTSLLGASNESIAQTRLRFYELLGEGASQTDRLFAWDQFMTHVEFAYQDRHFSRDPAKARQKKLEYLFSYIQITKSSRP